MTLAEHIFDWLFEHAIPWALLALIVLVVLLIVGGIYALVANANSPTFALRKDEWACTQSQRVPITTYIQSGNVMVPVTSYTTHCSQWSEQP